MSNKKAKAISTKGFAKDIIDKFIILLLLFIIY